MMTVTGFDTVAQAEARAPFYRSRGYAVEVIEQRSERAGSIAYLRCTYRAA